MRRIVPLDSKYSTAHQVMEYGSAKPAPTRNSSPVAVSHDHAPRLTLVSVLTPAFGLKSEGETPHKISDSLKLLDFATIGIFVGQQSC